MVVEKAPSEVLQAKLEKYNKLRAELAKIQQSILEAQRALEETRLVLKEIEKFPDDAELYRQMGFVLVPVKKADLLKELEERTVELEAKLSKLARMKSEHENTIKRLAQEIQSLAGKLQGGAALGG